MTAFRANYLLFFLYLSSTFLQGYTLKKEDWVCVLKQAPPSPFSLSPASYLKKSGRSGRPVCLPVKAGKNNGKDLYFYVRDDLGCLQQEPFITIVARGFAGRERVARYLPALKSTLGFANDNIIHNAALSFEFPDFISTFGFHQAANPLLRIRYLIPDQAKITLIGDCRGAVMSLEASADMPQADCIVLISGFLSVKELTRRMAETYLGSEYFAPIVRTLIQAACPVFNPVEERFTKELKRLKGKKILMCHYKGDHMVSRKNSLDLVNLLKENNTVYFHLIDHPHGYHSRLVHLPEVQACINAFFKECERPYCPQLAAQGKGYLDKAKEIAHSPEKYF